MAVVFLHGNPDNWRVWDELRARLDGVETTALRLPGFGAPRPDGFAATRWDYVSWLAGELEAMDGPVDLVTHDIGSVIGHGLVLERPEAVRTWACGSAACEPDYQWHVQARIWQTTRLGEQARDAWLSLDAAQRLDVIRAGGVPDPWSESVAEQLDAEQFEAAMAFYRSAVYVGDWSLPPGADLPRMALLWGRDDPFQSVEFGERVAERIGARLHVFEDCGHWWQLERTDEAAAALRELWEA